MKMANFKYKTIRQMQPRAGVKYATEYYKQTPKEYTRLDEHVRSVMETVVKAADATNMLDELERPLKGFPRTNRKPDYSAMDIMQDMLDQLEHQKDVPSGILGRWNRLFADNPDFTIDMQEDRPPNPLFNELFYK